MMGYHDGDLGWGSWLVMSLLILVILVAIVWGVFLIWRMTAGDAGAGAAPGPAPRTPEDILAERLARGEIDPEEYRRRLDALQRGGP